MHDGEVTTPAGSPKDLRIGNEERAAAQRALDEHLAAGRLEMDEFADRYAAAGMARTRAEIDALFTDLPAPHPFAPVLPSRPARSSAWQTLPVPALARVALLIVLGLALFWLLPFFAAGALVWFVVVPMLAGRGGPWRGCRRGWRY